MLGTTALAGGCGGSFYGQNCAPSVVVRDSRPVFDPVNVVINQPMGHLRSVHYSRSPNVSITRIHSLDQGPNLMDTPSGFTGGCHATSTRYCSGERRAIAAPTPAPVVDNSRFQPRQYGDATFVPGIAHVPTSYVDRSVENAQAALNSGRAVPQSRTLGGTAPNPSMVRNTGPRVTMYQNPVASQGSWEQVSGPTMIGGMMATKVMCKRATQTQVVRPIIGVPVPVPVDCAGVPHAGHAGHMGYAPQMNYGMGYSSPFPASQPGPMAQGHGPRWTY